MQNTGSRQDACPTEEMMPKNTSLRITRRRLPHWEMDRAVYFITFNTWERLELNEAARKIVLDSCQFFDNQRYVIFAIVVMPDHVHWLVQPLPKPTGEFWSLSEIMHSIKSYSAKQIPKMMAHLGTVFSPVAPKFHHWWRKWRKQARYVVEKAGKMPALRRSGISALQCEFAPYPVKSQQFSLWEYRLSKESILGSSIS